ncbi:MAG TPA: helix-turn-helix transcriptional regulator [Pseudothermotoga sp.]|nr:helix-turn-helix transcriptional regulator [Pseudothermotoga sp.]HOK84681.1 helix-turn-helix transcriptional regulator [Pseudothermotoga sp.]HPP71208.1 helix-turn-helix transcriptional regulator [Pseudothermotoga sp.]
MLRIRELREQKDLTQEALAKRANLSPKTISCYERGKAMPSFRALVRIAKALNVPIDILLEPETKETKEKEEVKA